MAEKTTGNKDKSPPQKLKERPLSPHLTIYKPQISSVMSISHRLSGIYLAFGAIVFAIWVCTIACGPDTHGILTYLLTTKIGYLFVFAWSLAIFYHLLNGIRHLFWDVWTWIFITSDDKIWNSSDNRGISF